MISRETVFQLVESWTEARGFFPVDVTVGQDNLICVEIEADRGSVQIDDCADLSRYIEEHLDRDKEDYSLEVSSAGIGQPFKVHRQFLKHVGKDVDVCLKDGRKLTGILSRAGEEDFSVTVPRKVRPEGAKRPVMKEIDEIYRYDQTAWVRYRLVF
ncbi:MAG: ribosome assembly cofactor RimP [Bacteroidales bacterium]|nr:ribosome assembly cofactor RimP [Bacteroidales bacterium]